MDSFYGPAPLHHTLLAGEDFTGITAQTLHLKHFDRGAILLQTTYPGIEHKCLKVEELSQKLAPKGADMLVDCIKNRLYLNDSESSPPKSLKGILDTVHTTKSRPAPKIKTADRFINWTTSSAEEIMRRHRIIGPLWNLIKEDDTNRNDRRVIWSSGFLPTSVHPDINLPIGQPVISKSSSLLQDICIRTCDNRLLKIRSIKIEGGEEEEPFKAARQARIHEPSSMSAGGPLFRSQISSVLPDQCQSRGISP